MSKRFGPTPTDLHQTIWAIVGPARISAFALLVIQSEMAQTDGALPEGTDLQTCKQRLSDALEMMRDKLPGLLDEVGMDADTFASTAPAVVTSLEAFGQLAQRAPVDDDRIIELTLGLKDLKAMAFQQVEPNVNAFLAQVSKLLTEEARRRDTVSEQSAETALKDVRRIASSIRMVAINASVEAARAGQAGAGFSVIAAETQSLAGMINTVLGDVAKAIQRT